jgi:hypothetical protein
MLLSFDGPDCAAVRTIEGSQASIDYLGGHRASYGAIVSTAFMLGW